MANTYVDYTGNGSTTDFNFSFPYIKTSHVAVEVNDGQGAGGTNQWVRKTLTTDYSVQTSPNTFVRFVTAPASNVKVRVLRDSDANEGIVDFANGSVLTETELDNSYQHNRYLAEEAEEGNTGGALTKRGTEHYNADGLKLENVADPDSDDDAVNKGYADTRYVDAAGDTMSGNLNMGANKVTSSATPSSGNDLTNKTYTDATFVDVAGDTMSGDLNMGGNDVVSTNSVQGLVTPTADTHAANKKYVDDNDALQVTKSGDTMSGDLNMGSNKITNVTDPSANQEAATKKYVDDTITTSFASGSPPPGNEIGTAAIEDDAVTYAKLQNVAGNNVLIGNDNGAGVDAQELTATEARTLLNVADGATANDSDANLKDRANHTGTQTAATISDLATVATSGSYNDLSNQPTIPTNNNQLTNGAGYTTNTGTVTSVDSGTGLIGGPITTMGTLSIADNGVTFAKMQEINTAKVIGRTTAGSGNPEEVSILDDDTMATASATSLATSESIKEYVDSQSSGVQVKCSFDGTASSPTANTGAVNVASITKTSTGDYTVNFTSSVSNPVASVSVVNASTGNPVDASIHTIGTTSVRIITGTNSAGRLDFSGVHLLVF